MTNHTAKLLIRVFNGIGWICVVILIGLLLGFVYLERNTPWGVAG